METFKFVVNSTLYGGLFDSSTTASSTKNPPGNRQLGSPRALQKPKRTIKTIINYCQEREKTYAFFDMLLKRSEEAKQHPETLISIEEIEQLSKYSCILKQQKKPKNWKNKPAQE